MPVNSYFFPRAISEQVENEAFLFNFGINKIIHNNLYKLFLNPSLPKNTNLGAYWE